MSKILNWFLFNSALLITSIATADNNIGNNNQEHEQVCIESNSNIDQMSSLKTLIQNATPLPTAADKKDPVVPAPITADKKDLVVPVPTTADKKDPVVPVPTAADKKDLVVPVPTAVDKKDLVAPVPTAVDKKDLVVPVPTTADKKDLVVPVPTTADKKNPVVPVPTTTDKKDPVVPVPTAADKKNPVVPVPTAADKKNLVVPVPTTTDKKDLVAPVPTTADKKNPVVPVPTATDKKDPVVPVPTAADKKNSVVPVPTAVDKKDLVVPVPTTTDKKDLVVPVQTEQVTKKNNNHKKQSIHKQHDIDHLSITNKHKHNDIQEEAIIIQEVILETELQERPIYDYKTVTLSPNISKKSYSADNNHLPKVFYQSEYTESLFDAVRSNDIQGIRSLIDKGANINAQEISSGYTPAMYAVKYNRIKALRALILHGANLQKTNLQGQTSLHIAANNGNAQAIQVLMTAGADPTIRDKKGNRASDYMKPNMQNSAMIMAGNYQDKTKALIDFVGLSSYDAVKYALDNGAIIDARDDVSADGDTPLIIAIKCQDVKMVSLLLNRGADLYKKNKKGQTPMQIAVILKNNEIIGILQTVKINREIESEIKSTSTR